MKKLINRLSDKVYSIIPNKIVLFIIGFFIGVTIAVLIPGLIGITISVIIGFFIGHLYDRGEKRWIENVSNIFTILR